MALDVPPVLDPDEGTPLDEEIASSEDALVRDDAEEPSRTLLGVVHDLGAVPGTRNGSDERAVLTATFAPPPGLPSGEFLG